jgi:PAS domain S-box-containing protein
MRILIAGDSAPLGAGVCVNLYKYGFDVYLAPTLEAAARRLREPGIDAVLLVISQSGCPATKLFSTIRQLNRDLPMVVLSDVDDRQTALEFVRDGAQDYLVKGLVSEESLARCLEHAIERNRVSLDRQNSEMRMKVVLECSYDAFITMDGSWHITDWNGLAEKTFGWKKENAIGRSVSFIIPHHLQRQFLNNIKTYFSKPEGSFLKTSREIIAQRKSGETFAAEFGMFRIDREGQAVFCAFLRDVSEIKKSKEELEHLVHERTEKLRRSNEQLQQFAKVASHDLQEPLRAVQGFTNLLAIATKDKLDHDCVEFMDYILDGTARMKQLVQSILIHSQVDSNPSIDQSSDCNSVMDEVMTNLRSVIDESDASFEIDPLPKVAVERSQLIQLFQNLISNSIKYRGASAPVISVTAEKSSQDWVFSFRDNGIGIEQQYSERIFDMFSRLHPKGRYDGTGIGLAICKRIVTAYGGRIWVESNIGQGSVFVFNLPSAKVEKEVTMKKSIKLLLVEDTPSDVRLTQEALKSRICSMRWRWPPMA